MKWFKHFTDNYRGRSVEKLYAELGHTGISCYYILTEICAEKLEPGRVESFKEDGFRLSFSAAFLRRNLRLSYTKLQVFLRLGQGLGLFSYKCSEDEIHIEYPILLELLDSDFKRSRSRREADATTKRLDIDIDKNIYIDQAGIDPSALIDPGAENKQHGDDSGNLGTSELGNVGLLKKEKVQRPVFDLESVYALYPRKEGKTKGMQKLAKEIKSESDFEDLKKAVQNYANQCTQEYREKKYIKQFSAFVTVWRDYIETESSIQSAQKEDWGI